MWAAPKSKPATLLKTKKAPIKTRPSPNTTSAAAAARQAVHDAAQKFDRKKLEKQEQDKRKEHAPPGTEEAAQSTVQSVKDADAMMAAAKKAEKNGEPKSDDVEDIDAKMAAAAEEASCPQRTLLVVQVSAAPQLRHSPSHTSYTTGQVRCGQRAFSGTAASVSASPAEAFAAAGFSDGNLGRD